MDITGGLTLGAVFAVCTAGALPAAPLRFSSELVSAGQKAPLQLRDRSIIAARPEAARSGKGVCVRCYRSTDMGSSWQAYSIIAEDGDPRTDLGDGHLVMRVRRRAGGSAPPRLPVDRRQPRRGEDLGRAQETL